ncbi:unnamed protein product [Leptidea sinapis]|uniref:C2H2-type domain-containing protein n=1 Tax=Leptidea sinapis TaxID=189913 RepID=A0A5E4R9J2_9NEOP|nr:unnamed protein product [Leptidea sinapis]
MATFGITSLNGSHCSYTSSSNTRIERKIRMSELENAVNESLVYTCGRCDIFYYDYKQLLEHLYWRHGTESLWCNQCDLKRWQYAAHVCNVLPIDESLLNNYTGPIYCFCGKEEYDSLAATHPTVTFNGITINVWVLLRPLQENGIVLNVAKFIPYRKLKLNYERMRIKKIELNFQIDLLLTIILYYYLRNRLHPFDKPSVLYPMMNDLLNPCQRF